MWKKIIVDGQETNYSVSDIGEVRNDLTGRLLKQNNEYEYLTVGLAINKKQRRKKVHRLVAEAFIPNPEDKPYVNHKDGVRYHNTIDNLEWVTPSENSQHAHQTGLVGYKRTRAVRQYDLQGNLMLTYPSIAEAARDTGAQASKINEVCGGTRLTAGYFQWRFDDLQLDKLPPVPAPPTIGKQVAQLDNNDNIIAIYPSFRAAAAAVGGTSSAISRICSNTPGLHTHKGYKWKIVDDIVQLDN